MLDRVVIGGGRLGRRLAQPLAAWPGELHVITADDRIAEDLREEGLPAIVADLTDPEVLTRAVSPDVVVVAADLPVALPAVLDACRRAFPDAHLVVVREDASTRLDGRVDQVIDTTVLSARGIVDQLFDPSFSRTLALLRALGRLADPVAVVMHDNPDPDAIAAAIGVVGLAASVGTHAVPYYAGDITHQQNRAFVTLLELDLEEIDETFDPASMGGIVLVDHAHPGVNDQLDPETPIDVIIDHHPSREEADAGFVDRRHFVGSTSTLVAHHLLLADIDIDRTLATALWYGMQVDTAGFRRGVSELDFVVGARLRPAVDGDVLEAIESPRLTAETLDTIADAIGNRIVRGDVSVSDVGAIHDRDALAQAADELLRMAGITTVCVLGSRDGIIYASARTRDRAVDVGDAIRLAYDRIGSAGGHDDMAGAQIPTGAMGFESTDGETRTVIIERFFEGVDMASRPLPSGYLDDDELPA